MEWGFWKVLKPSLVAKSVLEEYVDKYMKQDFKSNNVITLSKLIRVYYCTIVSIILS